MEFIQYSVNEHIVKVVIVLLSLPPVMVSGYFFAFIFSRETICRFFNEDCPVVFKAKWNWKNLIFGPLRLVINPGNLLLGNIYGELKIVIMLAILFVYVFVFVLAHYIFGQLLIGSDFKGLFSIFVGWGFYSFLGAMYVRLRHLFNLKWRYLVDLYNQTMMIKYSSRENGALCNGVLMNNLYCDILINGMWAEPDLVFIFKDNNLLNAFKLDFEKFKDDEDFPKFNENPKLFSEYKKNQELIEAWIDKKYQYNKEWDKNCS